jgi:hypothetical protein
LEGRTGMMRLLLVMLKAPTFFGKLAKNRDNRSAYYNCGKQHITFPSFLTLP